MYQSKYILLFCTFYNIYEFAKGTSTYFHELGYTDLSSKGS